MLRNHFFYVSAFENPSHQSASCFYLANFDEKKVLILKYSFSFLTSFAYFYRFIIIY